MFTTKFRATCAAVSTALLIATAVGPMTPISQAKPNTGKGPSKLSAHVCQQLKDIANSDSDRAHDAYAAGDTVTGDIYQSLADGDYQEAHKGGCAWAALRAFPRPVVVSVGGVVTISR